MAWNDEQVIGTLDVSGRRWRVTLSVGLIRVWADGDRDPRYILSADVPAAVIELMAEAARQYADFAKQDWRLG